MSNNNPHSHINQTAQNWNPLQIPSYIPRQPQLAHMSNERPMVRSPLAWHAAAPPPDSLYNFMSAANHKNLEHSMNPLLPPYVRGPPPFDSMDLSLQSNRSAGSPLNKSAHSLLPAPPPQLDYGHKLQAQQQQQQQQLNLQQQAQQQMHSQNNFPIHNLTTSSSQSQQHSNSGMPNVSTATAASTPTSPAQNNAKFLSSNGSDCEQPASLIQPAQNQSMGANNGNYLRDNYGKMPHINRAYDNDPHSKSLQKPVELVNKDCNYTGMMSNKMSATHLQQQHSTKKHSPLRSSSSSGYHQQQQQQQQHSPFNSPATAVKHNGPHTPPTPQSPSMHQSTQQQQASNSGNNSAQQHQSMLHAGGNNNANLINYNQLHLQQQQQQQQHNSYQQSPHLQQQHLHHLYPPQQQQQQPPSSHHHHHHQHWQQQHLTQHAPMPPQSPMQPPPFNSPLHPQQQQTQQNTLTNLEPASPATPSYALNTESNFEQRNLEQHPTAAAAPTVSPSNRLPQNIPDSAESPTTNASSNDDDSNTGSMDGGGDDGGGGSGDNKTLTPTSLQPTTSKSKQSNSNSPMSDKNSPQSNRLQITDSPTIGEQKKSPKNSPTVHHKKSPRKADIHSPESLDLSSKNISSPTSVIAASPQRTLTPQRTVTTPVIATLNTEESISQSANEIAAEKLKNGHTPPVVHEIQDDPTETDEVETIDKIAEMIAKTTSNSTSSQHSHHSHCSNSNDAHSNASSKSTRTEHCESPKTKKQRQALKLRNAEQSTQEWSTNSYNELAGNTATAKAIKTKISSPLISNDDNAVLADELHKPPPTHQSPMIASPHKRPLSPQSNSRSSSSSSSSSSCSNSTRSSYGNRTQKQKNNENVLATETDLTSANLVKPNDIVDSTKTQNSNVEIKQTPLNLNCKDNSSVAAVPTSTTATPQSPDKSKFEEVENKLEEMFAGIDDEPILIDDDKPESEFNKTPASDQIATDLSVALELSNSLSDMPTTSVDDVNKKQLAANSAPIALTSTVPIQTKAAKKSTVPSPIKPTTPPPTAPVGTTNTSNTTMVEDKTVAHAPSPAPTRKVMPRRRLSMALDPANLRIMLEANEKEHASHNKTGKDNNNEVICILDDERPSTSAAAAAAAIANVSGDDLNKQVKNRNNNNNDSNNSNTKGKTNNTTNANKTGNTKNNAAGGGGSGKVASKSTAKRTKANQQKQAQQKRRKHSSSEDELPTVFGRDAHLPTTITTGATAANISTTEKYKSPFILIKRDGSISVVNAATAEDSSNDKQTKGKKPPASYARHERRNIRGFHSSTLSQKYDADTTDSTWICVFCKRGPHRMGLGDLFGPYLVTIDCEEYKNATNAPDALNIDEEFVNKRKRADMVQCSPRGPPVVMATKAQETLNAIGAGASRMNKKKKKSIDESNPAVLVDPLDVSQETFFGMSKVSENSYEVWLHEDCSVWAPDVYLVGARIMGLDAAVWNSTRYQCVICTKSGATVCCLQRDCKAAAHIPCARESLWNLNENNWHVHCQEHADKNLKQQNTNSTQNYSNNNDNSNKLSITQSQQTKNS